MTLKRTDFPPGFVLGTATSAFQIEGATREDGRGESIWDAFCREPGRILDGSDGDLACEHYHRWEADFDLLRELGADAYRFSVAWPRVQPQGSGAFNARGLDFYDRQIDALLERGIQPFVTLYHWDLPQPLQEQGGWVSRDVAYRFAEYAGQVAARIGNRVQSIATLNEPWCSSFLSYDLGEHAPGLKDRSRALAAAHHLLLGHGLAMQAMRALNVKAQLGTVLNLTPAYAATDSAGDVAAARFADGYSNRWFLDPLFRGTYPQDLWEAFGDAVPEVQPGDLALISAPNDFLGVNYYTRSWHAADGSRPAGARYTHMDWEVYPQGLSELLLRLNADYTLPPVYITENGAAYADEPGTGETVHDPERLAYYEQHLAAVAQAARQGVDVRGYFAWSMLDNFEWAWGYTRRFGLFHVDYATQRRRWKDSGRWFQSLLRGPGIPVREPLSSKQ